MGLAQRLDQLGGVGRRDQDRVGLAGDDGVEHRHLHGRVEFGSALEHQFDAERVGGGLGALAHGDVEGIGGQARHQGDGKLLCILGKAGHRGKANGGGQGNGCHGLQNRTTLHSIPP